MKKLYNRFLLLFLVMSTFVFSACEDEYVGSSLQGTWAGKLYSYALTYRGHEIEYPSQYSEINFNADIFRIKRGWGVWVDHFYGDAPWRYYVDRFDWRVDDGVITLCFRSDNFVTRIKDYHITDYRFSGMIDLGGSEGFQRFELTKVSQPEDWANRPPGGYDRDGYPVFSRHATVPMDSLESSLFRRRLHLPK